MYLNRKIDRYLENWKADTNRKPLIVKGCRQVGKTESIRRFAGKHYESVIEINFVEEPKYRTILSDGYRTDDILRSISLIDPSKHFIPNKTLLFFDEIQQYPDIATALKFFCQDGRYDVICSGSLLGIHYRAIESNSVGYKTDYTMFSMDFEEFLWAKGYDDTLRQTLTEHMLSCKPLNDTVLQTGRQLFLEYCVLGGMPAVVRDFIEKGTFEGSLATQRQLVEDYKEDIRKYADGTDQTRILNVFNRIVPQLAPLESPNAA